MWYKRRQAAKSSSAEMARTSSRIFGGDDASPAIEHLPLCIWLCDNLGDRKDFLVILRDIYCSTVVTNITTAPLIRLQLVALYKSISIDWLIDWLIDWCSWHSPATAKMGMDLFSTNQLDPTHQLSDPTKPNKKSKTQPNPTRQNPTSLIRRLI